MNYLVRAMEEKKIIEVDMRGVRSPKPLFEVKKMLKRLKENEVLEILVTDRKCIDIIPKFIIAIGYNLLSLEECRDDSTSYYRIVVSLD